MISQSIYPYSPRKPALSSLEGSGPIIERSRPSALAPRSTGDNISVQRYQVDQGDVPTPKQESLTLPSPIIARLQICSPVLSKDSEMEDFSQPKPELDHWSRTTQRTTTVARIPESKDRALSFVVDRPDTPLTLSTRGFSSDNNSEHFFSPMSTRGNRESYLSANSVLIQPPEYLPLCFAATTPIQHPRPQPVDRIVNAVPHLDHIAESLSYLAVENWHRDSILHEPDAAGLDIRNDPGAMKEVYEYSAMGVEGSSDEEYTLA